MSEVFTLDPKETALVLIEYQVRISSSYSLKFALTVKSIFAHRCIYYTVQE